MILYHRTSREEADKILVEGFPGYGHFDVGTPLGSVWRRGVWFSASPRPPHGSHDESGSALLTIDIPEGQIDRFETRRASQIFREWLIPAEIIAGCPIAESEIEA
jgi:hypothetical protein